MVSNESSAVQLVFAPLWVNANTLWVGFERSSQSKVLMSEVKIWSLLAFSKRMGTSFCNSGKTSKGSERLSTQTTAFALLSALTNASTGVISSTDSIKQLSFSNSLISSKYASGEKQYNSSGLTTALLLFDSFSLTRWVDELFYPIRA